MDSQLLKALPKSIHAVAALEFELKVAIFVLSCSFSNLFR